MEQIDLQSPTNKVITFYSDMVYKLALAKCKNTEDAEDVFQEVFLRYIKKNPQFTDEEHRKAWLIRVTINCSNKSLTSPWRKRTEKITEDIYVKDNYSNELYYELLKLPEKYREVIHLYYYQDMSVDEIANALGKRSSSIRTRLARARQLLKKFMREEDYV
ncbi:MAG: sigma-70 family RNA polymerase sigma factor [Clostridia bacterium]|nr:sigma-70 family RNA polymerase sigma factor [Clostridia bacterium]